MPSSSTSSSSFSSTSFSTFTSTSSSSSGQHQPQAQTQTYTERATFNDRDGGRVERTTAATGQPTRHETTHLDPQGRRLPGAHDAAAPSSRRRIEGVIDDEGDAD